MAKIGKKNPVVAQKLPLFLAYDPFKTFSSDTGKFIYLDGDSYAMDEDHEALFELGQNIFKELFGDHMVTQKEFISVVQEYDEFIKHLNSIFKEKVQSGKWQIANVESFVGFENLDDTQILDAAWAACLSRGEHFGTDSNFIFKKSFLISALISINDVLISKTLDIATAAQTLYVNSSFNNALAIESKNENYKKMKSNFAKNNALLRLQRDPKEAAMQNIEREHDSLKPHQKTRGYLAPFARAMQEKYPVLQNPVSIETRIRAYKKQQVA